ncbi:hypothetical protein PCO31111_01444 [Pandoraea communis]|uniref:Uncharacterized protein n=1 Tax=Pandoraea communis TaxID=2508297 RepID=A0A5E4TIG8_9BURK|nr:hypothetical protein PCO31111_01444 [Pandoraea communis]
MLTLPFPDAASPVAMNAAVPPALMLLDTFFVLSTDDVERLLDEPQLSSIFPSGVLPAASAPSAPLASPSAPTAPLAAAYPRKADTRASPPEFAAALT